MKRYIAIGCLMSAVAGTKLVADQHSGEINCLPEDGCIILGSREGRKKVPGMLDYSRRLESFVLKPSNQLVRLQGLRLTERFDPRILHLVDAECSIDPEGEEQYPTSPLTVECGIRTGTVMRDLGGLFVYMGFAERM